MADIFKIKFIDIEAREKAAHQTLLFDIANLRARREKNKELSTADLAEFRRLKQVRNAAKPENKYFDPLFVATRAELGSDTSPLRQLRFEHTDGVLDFPNAADDEERNQATTRVALIFGLLQLGKTRVAPLVVDRRGNIVPDPSHPNAALFTEALFPAIGRADSRPGLPRKILEMMA